MELKKLANMPPWDWPDGAATMLLDVLRKREERLADRMTAAALAGNIIVASDEMAEALTSIVQNPAEPAELRGQSAISLGPVLEDADMSGFDEADEALIKAETFDRVQQALYEVFDDAAAPEDVRRLALEASVRAPQHWHETALRAAYSRPEPAWKVSALFGMGYVSGFEPEILEALESPNAELRYEAVIAAGNWEIDAAWDHVRSIVASQPDDKDLLIAAIGAVASIRPEEAEDALADLADTEDDDIAEAVEEALAMARGELDFDAEEGEGDEEESDGELEDEDEDDDNEEEEEEDELDADDEDEGFDDDEEEEDEEEEEEEKDKR